MNSGFVRLGANGRYDLALRSNEDEERTLEEGMAGDACPACSRVLKYRETSGSVAGS